MAEIAVDGSSISYEVIGDDGPAWIITPGGRFTKETPGVRELATAIAAAGNRVVVWDRPNTGASEVRFDGPTESDMQADALAGLLRALKMTPATIVGGSGGARVSLLAAVNHPDVVSRLAMLWISGGVSGLMQLGVIYCGPSIRTAWSEGMAAVAELPEWREVIEANPANRDRLLGLDRDEFLAVMRRWMRAYCPREDSTVPGVTDETLRAFTVPTLIFRSGESDPDHPRETSERLAELIGSARLVEPPWGDREWVERSAAFTAGSAPGLFMNWPALAPQLLEFAGS